jgi:hypothetical protein
MVVRKLHFAFTIALAAALCASVWIAAHDRASFDEMQRAKTQENALLRKRAETAEANSKMLVERFADAMTAYATDAGHLSGRALRTHEKSFVQIYAFYRKDRKNMATAGTACYLGGSYFLTARHIVIPEAPPGEKAPKTTAINIRVNGVLLPVRVVDSGEAEQADQIDVGDWPTPGYAFSFGERLIRYGNDSNRGIAPAAGYVAQVSENGWVSWLVDSLPGCSGGGVLNARDELVGLNGGYLDGSTRMAVILPIRVEMFRKLPKDLPGEP